MERKDHSRRMIWWTRYIMTGLALLLIALGSTVPGYGRVDPPVEYAHELVEGSSGDPSSYACRFYQAYISGEMDPWPGWIGELEREYARSQEPAVLYDILIAHYGYVAWLIGMDRHDRAKEYLDNGRDHLEELERYSGYRSIAESMRGAFLAYEIGMNRSKAVWLGPRSMKHINRAVELDAQNPIAWMEKGNAEYHMPRIFGGSYHKAAEYYQKAIRLFESNGSDLQCNWRYLNALAWLAQSYDKAGEAQKAQTTYQKILKIEPGFEWVKEELYPDFREDHGHISP